MENWQTTFRDFLKMNNFDFRRDFDLRKITTMRVGGVCSFYVVADDIDKLSNLIKTMEMGKIPYIIIGKGSNMIFEGNYNGVLVKLGRNFNYIKKEGGFLKAGAGTRLSSLVKFVMLNEIAGFEFLIGIPGTIGGAVMSNAGAFKRSISELIESILIMDKKGNLIEVHSSRVKFGYRLTELPLSGVIVEVRLKAIKGDKELIEKKLKEYIDYRVKTQPAGLNAGCIFKNPYNSDTSAGKLIDQAGCKGMRVGGAVVSSKHANFIINSGKTEGKDILNLINKIKKIVKEKYNIVLEEEVKIIKEGL